jgi:hypothetical protein
LLSSPQLYSSSRSHPGCLHSFMRFHNFKFHQYKKTLSYACYNRPIQTRKMVGITTQKASSL